jgi:two-component sensor histidine kinase
MNTQGKSKTRLKVLMLEDLTRDIEIIREMLIHEGYDLTLDSTDKEKTFIRLLRSRNYDVILADFKLPGFDGFKALHWSKEICSDVPFICISGAIGEETAVELLKQGAVDYILKDRSGRLPFAIKRALADAREMIERRQREELLRSSLEEKEVLLKEVHHRVKNNLMTLIGLIKMQEAKANNVIFSDLLQELESRVRAMAQVHESLHKSEDLAHVDLQGYIETMSAHVRAQFGADRDIHFSLQAAGIKVGLDIAIPCGLILNELIANAYKHAFPGNKPRVGEEKKEISVAVDQAGGIFTLNVIDNGVGVPAGLDWEKSETLGLRLVKMLSQQLNGSIELDRSHGTTFRLRFAYKPLDT